MTDTRSLAERIYYKEPMDLLAEVGKLESKAMQDAIKLAALESERTKLQGELERSEARAKHWQAETCRMSDGWKNSMLLRESLEDKLAAIGEIANIIKKDIDVYKQGVRVSPIDVMTYWERRLSEALATGAATTVHTDAAEYGRHEIEDAGQTCATCNGTREIKINFHFVDTPTLESYAYDMAPCPDCATTAPQEWCHHCGCGNDHLGYAHLKGCIATTAPQGSVPEGWQLVPLVPTDQMMTAFAGTEFSELSVGMRVREKRDYERMLAVAPQPPAFDPSAPTDKAGT